MANPTYPIGQNSYVVFRPGQQQPGCTLQNAGTVVIYVDSTPQGMNTSQGYPLNPGAVMPWEEAKALYAVCPNGTGQLNVVDAPGTFFDPSALATAINLVGVPAIDVPATLLSLVQSSIVSGATPASSTAVDVSRYQSVFLKLQDTGLTVNANTRTYTLSWYTDATLGTLLAAESFSMAQFGGSSFITRPVKGAFLVISATSAVTVTPNALLWTVIGSFRTVVPRTTLKSARNNTTGNLVAGTDVNAGVWIYAANIAGGGTVQTEWPDLVTGPQTLTIRTTSAPTDVLAMDLNLWNGQGYFSIALTVGAASSFTVNDFVVPPDPLKLTVVNFGGGTYDIQIAAIAAPT